MSIIKVAHDIFKFAPEHCDGVALWIGGFHLGGYWHDFLEQCRKTGCKFFRMHDNNWIGTRIDSGEPIEGGLYLIAPKLDQLQFLYLHPNPSGVAVVVPGNVQEMVRNAIAALNGVGCHFVAMNGIHAGTTKSGHNCERDGTNTQQTIDTIRTWRASSPLKKSSSEA
jgi:hypothetical protein